MSEDEECMEDDFDEDPDEDFDEDSDEEDEELEEVEQKKDYSNVPIMVSITAQILPSKTEGELNISLNGKAGPAISSGSAFGLGSSIVGDQATAIAKVKELAKSQAKWFECYHRPVKTKLVINDVPVDMNTSPLTEWFK